MEENNKKQAIETLKNALDKIENKEFKINFFVLDTKGNPSGAIAYIYDTAYTLYELGYNVQMLHQEKEFVGVVDWLGEKYNVLQHANIETDNVSISVSDILVIPEIFSNVMSQTKNMPCKRVVLLQNFNYLTEFIPIGATWEDFKIYDVVTTSKGQEKLIKEIFPNIRSQIVSPSISNTIFRESKESKQPIVNIVAKNQSDVNKIVKPFYWKYPTYKWVSFRDLRGLPKTEFAKSLQEAAITVWVDTDTNFGYSPIEAIKCGSIVIGKIPETIPDWMINENGELKDNGVWFSNMNSVHELIASVLRAWTYDEIPNEIADEMQNMNDLYTNEIQKEEIKKVYIDGFVKQRKTEIEILVNTFKNNNKEEEKVTEE